ncbi:MAG: DUF3386 family protein, partial [Lentisphaeraceae bacterium]|nr:DUF3386 family protein [Lentisphaeraceae bacterium]
DTGNGLLSKKYTSQQIDPNTLKANSLKLEYEDSFINIGSQNIWLLNSRSIRYLNKTQEEPAWTNVLKNIKPKGVPFHNTSRKIALYLNNGMWTENAVLDAATELSLNQNSPEISCNSALIPRGHYFSMSSINLAIRSEVAPLMYFLLMGEDYPFEGFGDIWAGVIAKKIMDHLNMGCRSGEPFVKNYKQMDIWKSLRAESNSLPVNESLWEKIDSAILTSKTPATCYAEIAGMIGNWGHPYFQKLSQAMKIWSGLYTGETESEPLEESDTKSPSQLLSYIKEPEPKTIRPKLPSESESLLEFLHNKSQIHESEKEPVKKEEETKEASEEKAEETKSAKKKEEISAPKGLHVRTAKEKTSQRSFSETSEDEVLTVKIIEEDEDSKAHDMKKYSQRLNKEDLKPYVANPRKLLIKKPSNDAFVPKNK